MLRDTLTGVGERWIIAMTLLLAGCVPPGVRSASAPDQPAPVAEPPIEPELPAPLTTEKAVWEARPAVPNAVTVRQIIYVVRPGDTLRAIGETTGAGSETIARVNNLVPPFVVKVGQALTIPGGRYHRVGSGETGIAIARAYGIPWHAIVAANNLAEPFVLRIGQRLLLPGTAAPPSTVEARAAAFRVDIDDIATGAAPARTPDTGPETGYVSPAPAAPRFGGRFSWPVPGRVTDRFGSAGEGRVNRGIEIAAPTGEAIRATADGIVAFVGNGGSAGYGGLILIRHGGGWISAYGRAASATVARGQSVRAGDIIGRTGNEGLHFQLRQNRTAIDPVAHLPPR